MSFKEGKIKLSIFVPVFNAESFIEKNVRRLNLYCQKNILESLDYNIYVVDNASVDKTRDICLRLEKEILSVNYMRIFKRGKGVALSEATKRVDSDWYCFIDSDLPFDLSIFKRLQRRICLGGGDFDLIVADRREVDSSLIRRVVSLGYKKIANFVLFGYWARVRDFQAGFKAWSRSVNDGVWPKVVDQKFFFDTELIYYSIKLGFKISYMRVNCKIDALSSVRVFSDSVKFFLNLLMLRLR